MITCRPQASVDRLYKALCAPTALPYSLRYFQGLFQRLNSSHAMHMDGVRDWSNKMDKQKKLKSIVHGRRPISTQGVPKEGYAWRPISTEAVSAEVIEGNDVESVTKASEKITTVLEEAVKSPKLDYSHFVSLPLAIHPALVQKLHHFQNSILGNSSSSLDDDLDMDLNDDTSDETGDDDKQAGSSSVDVKFEVEDKMERVRVKIDTIGYNRGSKNSTLSDLGIERSIFINPKTFHLTVLMLKLWNKDRIAAASEVLQSISSKVKDALDNRPISIRLKGLTCMRGSPAKAYVVYAPVIEVGGEGRLLRACQVIIDAFVESGLVLDKDARHTLKLHATLMNVRHRKRSKRTGRNSYFDARHIFRVYGSEDWGEYHIPVVHLSQRFKYDESGYYHCCSSIPLPEDMQTE